MAGHDDALDRLVTAVHQSPKYGQVCTALVRRIGAAEIAKRRNLKEAIKATKNKLHQVGGAYLDKRMPYADWLATLTSAARTGDAALREASRSVMQHHASTRERLPILESFFATTLADLAPVRSVVDVACGLNPLAVPWMPLAPGATYTAYDIYHDLIDFVGAALALYGMNAQVMATDVLQQPPTARADVALILKTIPCLEQIDRRAGVRLLDAIDTDYALISFPVRSLGGYDKGMAETYETRWRDLLAPHGWRVQRFQFETELAFLVDRREGVG